MHVLGYECLNNQPLTCVCPWASGLGVRPGQVADVHWTDWDTAQKVWLLPHTNFVKNTLGCTYNYVEYYCLREDATVTCSHTHTHTHKYIQRTGVVRCTLQLSQMCVFLLEFYFSNDRVTY